jgi:hypothetical protein
MANEEVWSLPIKQDGIPVGTLDGDGAERTRNRFANLF